MPVSQNHNKSQVPNFQLSLLNFLVAEFQESSGGKSYYGIYIIVPSVVAQIKHNLGL